MSNVALGFLPKNEANEQLCEELLLSRLKDIYRDYETLSLKDPAAAKAYKETMICLVGSEDGFLWDPYDLHKLIKPMFESAGLTYGDSARAAIDALIEAVEQEVDDGHS